MKTIKELESHIVKDELIEGYWTALKDVLEVIDEIHTTDKVGLRILKEIRKRIVGERKEPHYFIEDNL